MSELANIGRISKEEEPHIGGKLKMQPDVPSLIAQLKSGNKLAFSQLYRYHYPRIFSFLYSSLKDRFLAEDFTQDLFFRLWVNREHLDEDMPLDPYFFTMAKHTVLNFYKRKEVEKRYLETLTGEPESPIEENVYCKELQRLINEAIDSMPAQQQKVFQLSREEGLANTEIANQLHISKRTVEKHISNSLKLVRRVIEKNYLLCFFL
jgi:RNA polymerase sigma-70 factor (ECF subfamily)